MGKILPHFRQENLENLKYTEKIQSKTAFTFFYPLNRIANILKRIEFSSLTSKIPVFELTMKKFNSSN